MSSRRLGWLPATCLGVIAAVSSGLSPGLETCIVPRKCDEGARCEVLRQLSMWRQLRNLYSSEALRDQAVADARAEVKKEYGDRASAETVDNRAAIRFQQLVMERANDGKTVLLPDCASGLEDPPGFSVDDNCLIRASRMVRNAAGQLESRDLPKGDVEGIRACRELVEAARSHEEHHRIECCKVSCQSGCSVSECDEVSRRQRCAKDPSRDECRSAYASTKGVPPAPPPRGTIKDFIREEQKGYDIAIKNLRDELMAKQPKCTVADAKFRKAQEDLIRRAKLLTAKKGGGK
jgi:hypothetical protein